MRSRQEEYEGTSEVRSGLEIDGNELDRYLAAHIDGYAGPLHIEQFKGGQSNPTYKLTTPTQIYVLRRKPPGKLLKSAHAMDREYKLLKALHPTGLPVARPYLLEEDETIIGTAFYVMEFVDGRILWESHLPGMSPHERAGLYDAMNETIARLHMIDHKEVGLGDYGKGGDYIRRQVNRWSEQYRQAETETIPAMDNLIDWLPDRIPTAEDVSVVHGDYRIDNLIFHPTEPKVRAILDWELSTIGHPLADFSYATMMWRLPPSIFNGIRGLDLAALGIPSEQDYVAAYCQRTGRAEIPDWDIYMIYNIFRLASIAQGIMGRVKTGTATSAHAIANGKLARPLAETAWDEVKRLKLDA